MYTFCYLYTTTFLLIQIICFDEKDRPVNLKLLVYLKLLGQD